MRSVRKSYSNLFLAFSARLGCAIEAIDVGVSVGETEVNLLSAQRGIQKGYSLSGRVLASGGSVPIGLSDRVPRACIGVTEARF